MYLKSVHENEISGFGSESINCEDAPQNMRLKTHCIKIA